METVLLNIITLPDLEEALIDWLLERDEITGFSSNLVSGHGSQHTQLNMSEQVAGRQKQVLVQIQTTRAIAEAVINDLKRDFAGTDIHYWLLPVLAAGHLGNNPP